MLVEARKEQLVELERALHYRFHRLELLNQALIHKSYVHEQREPVQHNERLEFLGDAVLGLVISDYCYRQFVDLAEGELSKLRASLVNDGNLARIARRLELGSTSSLDAERNSPAAVPRPLSWLIPLKRCWRPFILIARWAMCLR